MAYKLHKASNAAAFASLEKVLIPYTIPGRTTSAAFLVWFLQTIYRLEEVEAQDAVCDKKLDKGVDAIFVNDGDEEVVLFQAKRSQSLPGTLGDTDLKAFIGALAHFRKEESIAELASTTQNPELKRLLTENRVAEKVGKGYKLRPVFVANIAANDEAHEYVRHASASGDIIDLWDLERISPILDQVSHQQWFVHEKALLKVDPKGLFFQGDEASPDLIMAAVSAKELIKLTGISDTRIFAQNVRLGLGKTRVNTELITSIKDPKEHERFLAYHNGMTIVAKEIQYVKGNITIQDYSVSNGCQSLLSLFNNQTYVTNKLILPVRIVKVGDDRSLAASIAYKTNNQNPISLRDLSANDSTQTQIKAEYDSLYGFTASYMIKRGAASTGAELPNELAGQLLLALYALQPWSAHQKYKIFGGLQGEIFKYGIGAPHIRLGQLVMQACDTALSKCAQPKIRNYGLTRFLTLYFVGELLRKEEQGRSLLDDPKPYLRQAQIDFDRGQLEDQLAIELASLAAYAVTELNYYVQDHGNDAYDYKSEFKSEKNVKLIRSEILKSYDKDRYRDKVDPFRLPVAKKLAMGDQKAHPAKKAKVMTKKSVSK